MSLTELQAFLIRHGLMARAFSVKARWYAILDSRDGARTFAGVGATLDEALASACEHVDLVRGVA